MKLTRGLTQIYTGDGKGKTTAAFGLALRAAGHGLRVGVIQFMKERVAEAGELRALAGIENIEVMRFGRSFIERPAPSHAEVAEGVARGLTLAREALIDGRYDVLILDEICTAVALGVADPDSVPALVKAKSVEQELVLTGRGATEEMIVAADLVTEMKAIKHPYDLGIPARKGIDY